MRRLIIWLFVSLSSLPAMAEDCVHEMTGATGVAVLARPVAGSVMRGFGLQYDELQKAKAQHQGIDLDAAAGEPVYAAGAGKVVEAGQHGDLGSYIRIDHGNGLASAYGHLGQMSVVAGTCVKAGQEIAKSGATGATPRPQLHFEVWRDAAPVDPLHLLQ